MSCGFNMFFNFGFGNRVLQFLNGFLQRFSLLGSPYLPVNQEEGTSYGKSED